MKSPWLRTTVLGVTTCLEFPAHVTPRAFGSLLMFLPLGCLPPPQLFARKHLILLPLRLSLLGNFPLLPLLPVFPEGLAQLCLDGFDYVGVVIAHASLSSLGSRMVLF